VEQMSGTLVTIARDVKIQVELNPATVAAYRQIGYENRALRHEEFNDDAKSAGDVGAGHTVTALYELVPVGSADATPRADPLQYQRIAAAPAGAEGELMTVKVRYKAPEGDRSELLTRVVRGDGGACLPSGDFQFAAAVASFGLLLRGSPNEGLASWDLVAQ